MNELVQLGNLPPHLHPQTTFKTASTYFPALAEMHITHLTFQHNNAIESAKDCRRKYITRCLFRKLAIKPFCDDFRPANALTNSRKDFKVV